MKVFLILNALVSGQPPHVGKLEMPSYEDCQKEAGRFYDYAMQKDEIEKFGAACVVEKPQTNPS